MSHAQAVGQGRGQDENADVVDAASHVEDRRDAQGAANGLEARAGVSDGLGHLEPGLGVGDGGTPRIQHQDVVFDQLPRQGDVAVVMLDLGVVAPHDARPPRGSGRP